MVYFLIIEANLFREVLSLSMHYDLAVVGAGVAGSCAAFAAAKRGLSVVLLEKKELPRYKLCGGGVTRKTMELLAGEGIRLPLKLFHEVRKVRVKIPGAEREIDIPRGEILTTYRDVFDFALTKEAERAGAEVRDATGVKGVKQADEGCVIKTERGEVRARFVIGCDGVSSIVRKHLFGWRFSAGELGVAAEYEVPGLSLEAMEIYFGYASLSYAWAFPKAEGATIGIAELASRLKESIASRLESFASALPYLDASALPPPRAHLIPMGGIRRKVAAPRALLAGDAAGFVDPLSGEGTYYAALSGIKAAQYVSEALRDEERLLAYQSFCDRELLPDLRAMLYLSRLFYFNLDFSYHMFLKSDVLLSVISALGKGEPKPREILKRAVLYSLRNLPSYVLKRIWR